MDNSEYLAALSGKLQSANRSVLLQKKRQREQIQQRLQSIEIMFASKKKFEIDSMEKAKFSTDKISTLTSQTIKNFNLKTRKQEELVRNLKDQMQNELDNIQREHHDKTEIVIEHQTQKMTQMIQQISKKSRHTSQATQKSLAQLTKSIANLQKDLQDEIQQRRNNCRQIEQDISNQVSKFNSIIEREREHRVVSEQKIENMMEEIKNKIGAQIQSLSVKRKKNNGSLLKLIESACQRLEQKLSIRI